MLTYVSTSVPGLSELIQVLISNCLNTGCHAEVYTTNQPVTVSENASKFNSHYLLIISRKFSLNLDIPFRS